MAKKIILSGLLWLAMLTPLGIVQAQFDPCPSIDPATLPPLREDGARLVFSPVTGSAQNPAFSPDSERLIYTHFSEGYNDGPAAIYCWQAPDMQGIALTPPGEDADNVNLPGPVWNAHNGLIVFASDRQEHDRIWMVDPATGQLDYVPGAWPPGSQHLFEPSWSPDGAWIVFELHFETELGQEYGTIWKVRTDGTDLTQLTLGAPAGFDDRQPAWAPVSDRILFQRTPLSGNEENWDIYTIDTAGEHLTQITTWSGSDTDAAWSPDANWMVYSSNHGNLDVPVLFAIPSHGGDPVQITFPPVTEDAAPVWSPDGQWIAFESHREGDNHPASLWIMAVPGWLD